MKLNVLSLSIFSFLALGLAFSSCENGTELGQNVLPYADSMKYGNNDTSTVLAYTVEGEACGEATAQNALFGTYNDPVFGKAYAEFFANYNPSVYNKTFSADIVRDSIVLFLSYNQDTTGTHVGSRGQALEMSVYPLTSRLEAGKHYTPDDVPTGNLLPLGSLRFKPTVGNDTLVRIKLSQVLATELTNTNYTDAYGNAEKFHDQFYGLYFKLENKDAQGAITYFDPQHEDSKIRLYYHTDEDTTHYDYNFDDSDIANIFWKDQEAPDLTQESPDSLAYMQAMGYYRIKIQLPYLADWRNLSDHIIINRAELIVTPSEDQKFGHLPYEEPPYALELLRINEDGMKYPLDEYLSSSGYSGETYDEENDQYVFDISRYIQQTLNNKKPNFGMYLMVQRKGQTARRLIVEGSEQKGIKLIMKYSLY